MIDYYAGHGHLIMSSVISQLTAMRELLLPPDEILSYINSSCRSNNPLLQLIATSFYTTELEYDPGYDTPTQLRHTTLAKSSGSNKQQQQQQQLHQSSAVHKVLQIITVRIIYIRVCTVHCTYSMLTDATVQHNWESFDTLP